MNQGATGFGGQSWKGVVPDGLLLMGCLPGEAGFGSVVFWRSKAGWIWDLEQPGLWEVSLPMALGSHGWALGSLPTQPKPSVVL